MARAFTAKAAKDYPQHGIKKGDQYWYWSVGFRGSKQMSATRPRQSQLTGSACLSAAYAAQENFEDALDNSTTRGDVIDAIETAIGEADDVISEYDDSIGNLQDAFPGGCPALEEKEEQRGNVEEWKDELDNAKTEIEGLDEADYKKAAEDRDDPEDEDEIDEDKLFDDAIGHARDVSFNL